METFGQKQTLESQGELVGFDKGEFICCFIMLNQIDSLPFPMYIILQKPCNPIYC